MWWKSVFKGKVLEKQWKFLKNSKYFHRTEACSNNSNIQFMFWHGLDLFNELHREKLQSNAFFIIQSWESHFFFIIQLKQKKKSIIIPYNVLYPRESLFCLKSFEESVSFQWLKDVVNATDCNFIYLVEIFWVFEKFSLFYKYFPLKHTFYQMTYIYFRQFPCCLFFCHWWEICFDRFSSKFQKYLPERKVFQKKIFFAPKSGQKFVHPPLPPFLVVRAKNVHWNFQNIGHDKKW